MDLFVKKVPFLAINDSKGYPIVRIVAELDLQR